MALAVGEDMSLFRRTPRNSLDSIVFADGTIKEVRKKGDQVDLFFEDYCNSMVSISFHEVSRLIFDEDIAREEVMDVQFYWTGTSWTTSFKNDDQETILEISYKDAQLI